MTRRNARLFLAAVLAFAGLANSRADAQQNSLPVKSVQLAGLAGVKDNTKGTLTVEKAQLHFVHGKGSSDVSAASIQDVVTGADSRESVGKTVGMMSMAAPYGGGRFLSLFRTRIDTLTVQYRDADGGLHGAIFTMAAGAAEVIKKELLTEGAHAAAADMPPTSPATATTPEQKQ